MGMDIRFADLRSANPGEAVVINTCLQDVHTGGKIFDDLESLGSDLIYECPF